MYVYIYIMDGHIIITGTGRCGTTFMIRLFTLLNLDTGYTPDNMNKYIYTNCNSGMEQSNFKHKFIKNPKLSLSIKNIKQRYNISLVIVPIRNLDDCTKSRLRNGNNNGGYFKFPRLLKTHHEIINENYKRLAILTQDLIIHDIPHIFINFNKMTNPLVGPKYLYNSLKKIIEYYDIKYDDFNRAYIKAHKLSI